MICSLVDRADVTVSLTSPRMKPVAEVLHAQLAHRTTELFRALYPGLKLEENSDPLAPAGQVGADGVVRYNPRSYNPSTLFHEHGHIWFAPVEAAFPEQAEGLLQQMQGTRALARARALYPDLDEAGQQKEAFMEIIGQTGSQALASYEQRAQTALGRFYNLLDKWLFELTDKRFAGRLESGKVTLGQITKHVSRQLLYGSSDGTGAFSQYTASHLRRLITAAVDQRLGIGHTVADFMEFVSGKHTGAAQADIAEAVDFKYEETKGRDVFYIGSPQSGGGIPYSFSSTDMITRKREIAEKMRHHAPEKDASLVEQAVDFFALSEQDRQKRMYSKDNTAEANADRLLTLQLHELFPGFEDGDTVVPYGPNTSPQYYDVNSPFNTGTVVLHISRQPGPDGKPVVAIASLTTQSLKEAKKGELLLAGVMLRDNNGNESKSTWNKIRLENQSKATNLKMTSTALNLHGLQMQLLAMHLSKKYGVQVSNLAVGKIDTTPIKPNERNQVRGNQTLQVLPLPMLLALKAIRSNPAVRAALTAAPVGSEGHALLQLLDDESLYNPDDYRGSALAALEQRYSRVSTQKASDTVRLLGEVKRYRKGVQGGQLSRIARAVSARELQNMIFAYLRELHEDLGSHNADLLKDPEFLLLTEAHQELAGLSKHLTLPGLAGSVESVYTSFSANSNPFIQVFLEQWDADRNRITERFLAYKELDKEKTAALIAEVEQTGLRTVGNRIVHRESSYYEHLMRKETFDWRNPKTGQIEKKQVPVYAFHQPGSAEFKKLGPAARDYIEYKLKQIKEHVTARHARDLNARGKALSADEMEQWYRDNWGQGQVPLVHASVRSQVFRGEIADAGKEWLERLLDENPLHDSKNEAGYYTLNDNYFLQGGEGQYGSAFRVKQLGLILDEDYRNAQGQAEERYKLRSDGVDSNNQLEDDLRQAFDIFEMNQLKQELLADIGVYHKMAKAAMRKQEDELGTYVRPSQNTADGNQSDTASPDEKLLDAMVHKLVYNKREQPDGVGTKRIRNTGAVAASVTSAVAMGFNPMIPVKNQAQFTVRALAIAGANGKDDVMFGLADVAWAAKEFFKPAVRAKLYALGLKYRMLRTDEHDLINETNISGRKRQVLGDLGYWSMWPNKIQDDASALFTLLCQMKHENTWDSYEHSDEKGLVYNEVKDRKNRGDAVVDAVYASLIQDGTLQSGQKLDRTYDGFLRRNLNSLREEMLGGYDSLSMTLADTKWHGPMFKQMRGWLLARVTGAFGDERQHLNRGKYDSITGEKIHDYQSGVFTSLVKYMSNAATFGHISPTQLKNLTATDRKNLRLIMYNTAIAASLYLIGRILAGGWDDDDKNKDKDKSLTAVSILDAAIAETFVIYQAGTLYNAIDSPIVSVASIGKLGQLFGDVVMLDGHGAWQDVKRTVGVVKGINVGYNLLTDKETTNNPKKQ